MRTNTLENQNDGQTYEGAPAKHIDAEAQLRRSVMSCMLWEREFYEDGVGIAERITSLVPHVAPKAVQAMAIEARTQMHLRHAPLWLAIAMLESPKHRPLVADTLAKVINRADELAEVLAMYWKNGRRPVAAQLKKGIARAFVKFDAYQLAKYNRANQPVKLRDALFISHAKPKDDEQKQAWQKLIDGTLESPDTWEVALSAGGDKFEHWTRLIAENKLGGLALLRNLRNMIDAKVADSLIRGAIQSMNAARVLPFRFIAAARYAPRFESDIEVAMLASLAESPKLHGTTAVLVDVSYSMVGSLSEKSDMTRMDAACGVAMVAREICEHARVFTFSQEVVECPNRRGFALRDAVVTSQAHSGTWLGKAVRALNREVKADRIIVVTDEQSHDRVPGPNGKGYMINVAIAKNGVGYGPWTHIDGWSESVIRYIQELENNA